MGVFTEEDGHAPRQIITTPNAPSSPLYSQGVKAGSQALVSGTTGVDPSTGGLAGDAIQQQVRQALANCEAILRRAARASMTSSRWASCPAILATSPA